MIVGQAPGTRLHETGIPWNDRLGDRLREWLQVDLAPPSTTSAALAVIPAGFCYPGRLPQGGDPGRPGRNAARPGILG